MPQVLGQMGNIMGGGNQSVNPWLSGGMGILGTLRNIFGMAGQDKFTKSMQQYEQEMQNLARNPNLIMAKARQFQQPLSTGLQQSVGNDVQAQLAERGLTASPQIATQVMGQALAPYEQRQQELGLQAAYQALGLPMAAAGAVPKFEQTDTTEFWRRFLPRAAQQGGGMTFPIGGGVVSDAPGSGNWGGNYGGGDWTNPGSSGGGGYLGGEGGSEFGWGG